jgi:DNA-binding transcriptional MerR regulator
MSHHPAGQPAADPVRPVELGDQALLERIRSHAGESTASSALEVNRLTIGELGRATGVATSALRYWEELGLLPAPERVAGQRRYPATAVGLVGVILLLQDAGFTLRELKELMASRADGAGAWRELQQRKLDELDEQIARAQAARTALAHGLDCANDGGVFQCPNFARGIAARLAGLPLREAHAHVHR